MRYELTSTGLAALTTLLAASCATTPSTPEPIDDDEIRQIFDGRVGDLRTCYSEYLASFGGYFEDDDLQRAKGKPTVADVDPWYGEVRFTVEVDGDDASVDVEDLSGEGAPDPLDRCWSVALESARWPAREEGVTIERSMKFGTD